MELLQNNLYLGPLCLRGHHYNGTGKSIRYKVKGRELGGVCVVCNRARLRPAKKKKERARSGVFDLVRAKCPMCKKFHKITIEGGWMGNGTPWKYCSSCEQKRRKLTQGAVDYGYSN